ncbi:MAG TPA: hypothetical protein VGR37_16875, partial [Longimicrobiaceae bacterium]|nr:hypothetical protein [Longimicrobiaceae bacterium]
MSLEVLPRTDVPVRHGPLRGTGLLDAPPEEAFDRITRLAARVLRAPVALVALLDGDRLVVKSAVGLPADVLAPRALPAEGSFAVAAAGGP